MRCRPEGSTSPAAFAGFVLGVVLMPGLTCLLTAASPRIGRAWAAQHAGMPWMTDVIWYGAGIAPLMGAAVLYLLLPTGWRRFTGALLAGTAALAGPVLVLLAFASRG